MLRILDGFLIRAYSVLLGAALGAGSTLAVRDIPARLIVDGAWAARGYALQCLPVSVRPLTFRLTSRACGVGHINTFEASDGGQMTTGVYGSPSRGAAEAEVEERARGCGAVVARSTESDASGACVGRRLVVAGEEGVLVIWNTDAEISYVAGPSLHHVQCLLAIQPDPW